MIYTFFLVIVIVVVCSYSGIVGTCCGTFFPIRYLIVLFSGSWLTITKACLYNFDPLKHPLLYSKTGVYRGIHYFSNLAKNTDCGYSLEPPREAVLTNTHNLCYERNMKNIRFFYLKMLLFFAHKIFNIFE